MPKAGKSNFRKFFQGELCIGNLCLEMLEMLIQKASNEHLGAQGRKISFLNTFLTRPMYWADLSGFCEGAEFLAIRRHKSAERWLVGHCT